MDWQGKADGSGRVEDRRGIAPGVAAGGGILSLVIMAAAYFLGVPPDQAKQLANVVGGRVQKPAGEANAKPLNDKTLKFTETIIAMTDDVWVEQFRRLGDDYDKPKMVLFSQQVTTRGCGTAPSAVGPFYCPADRTVYLDPTFFEELEQKLGGSKAEFSQAYVIAHEVGHHVQNLLGYNDLLNRFRGEGENAGIRLELQADYLAGVWAHHANKKKNIIERGDVEEAFKTAIKIGDDAIQSRGKKGGWVNPESFNHGTSDQRVKYFKLGLETGDASKAALDRFFDRNTPPLRL
jgi:uncharacterized protein